MAVLLSGFGLISAIVITWIHKQGIRNVRSLEEVNPVLTDPPMVSVVIAARNEQTNMERALRSLLRLDYPRKEIIVVNDRSTDGTGFIIDDLKKSFPELITLLVTELPDGWLGKNHAQYLGSKAAHGDLILFTDADVVMKPPVLSRAVAYMREKNLAHLAILPQLDSPSPLFSFLVFPLGFLFNVFTRAGSVEDPGSGAFVGIGAFNMIRRDTYHQIGTHQAIRLRPDDDMRLGQLVKLSGARQGFLLGVNMISVEWYESVRGLIHGLMKNSFSAVNYQFSLILAGTVAIVAGLLWPFFGVAGTEGLPRWMNAASCVLLLSSCAESLRWKNENPWYGLGLPFSLLLVIFISWKAALQTVWKGGIEWRGTFYSLKALREHRL